ncbi:MAG: diguanylate cyclase [Acidimicrobiales bacterium]|nr:diguanylate cyclase [Acidimicrobiales bacterium]
MRSRVGRAILAFLLLSQLATIIGLVTISRHEANQLVDERSVAVLHENIADARHRLDNHLIPAEALLGFTENVLSDGAIEPQLLEGAFREILVESPQVAGSFVGDELGNFFYVSRTEEGIRVKEIDTAGDRSVNVATYDQQGMLIRAETLEDDTYDPRARPWYGVATDNVGAIGWTDPYVFFTSQQPGITAAKAIVRDDEIQGVVGVDVELGALSEFLLALRPAENGEAVIVDSETGVILGSNRAAATGEPLDAETQSEIEAVIGEVVDRELGAEVLEVENTNGETERVAFRQVEVGDHDWIILMMGTEKEVVGELAASKERDRRLQLIAGAIALAVTAIVAAPILRPVRELEHEAQIDVLTELPNRRSIMEAADRLSSSASPHAFAMVDVDRFKLVNDEYGHQVGDEVLCEIALRLSDALEMGDHIGRIGGEEFVALLRGDAEQTSRTAERMLRAVSESPIPTSDGVIPVTVSIGLATAPEISDEVRLLADADSALLAAKSAGRNRIMSFDVAKECPVEFESVTA